MCLMTFWHKESIKSALAWEAAEGTKEGITLGFELGNAPFPVDDHPSTTALLCDFCIVIYNACQSQGWEHSLC